MCMQSKKECLRSAWNAYYTWYTPSRACHRPCNAVACPVLSAPLGCTYLYTCAWVASYTSMQHALVVLTYSLLNRCLLRQAPVYLTSKFVKNSYLYSSTRGANKLHIPYPRTNKFRLSFEYQGAYHYNQLPQDVRSKQSLSSFILIASRASKLFPLSYNNNH